LGARYGDRVQETTTTTGTGTVSLGGAVAGFQTFSSVLASGDRCHYAIVDSSNNWEVGQGTYTSSGDTLSRDVVWASSNSGALISIAAGTTNVWLDSPARAEVDVGLAVAFTNRLVGM
jgi:hypothetical protein